MTHSLPPEPIQTDPLVPMPVPISSRTLQTCFRELVLLQGAPMQSQKRNQRNLLSAQTLRLRLAISSKRCVYMMCTSSGDNAR